MTFCNIKIHKNQRMCHLHKENHINEGIHVK